METPKNAAQNPRSEKTGFARGDIVEWDDVWLEDDLGRRCIEAGRGVVTMPNDGGFVWIENEARSVILAASEVRRAT